MNARLSAYRSQIDLLSVLVTLCFFASGIAQSVSNRSNTLYISYFYSMFLVASAVQIGDT